MKIATGLFLGLLACLTADVVQAETNITVAADGSGQFKTVQEAIMSVPAGSARNPVFIHLKPGVYKELIYIQHEKRFFRLIGESATNTVLTYNLNANIVGPDGKPIGTFRTPSTVIDADDFAAENITFENSAGPVGQALAIRIDGDRATFRNCRFLGWQDTVFANRGRQYFENCYIAGHVDFIFGGATMFFENCHIHSLRNGYLTAASTPDNQPFGYVFSNCRITGESNTVRCFLGRPWRIHASTIFLNTEMSEVVRPEGWNNWNKREAEKTARYAEYHSTGPGANPSNRVAWAKMLTKDEAAAITMKTVLSGSDNWNPKAQTTVGAARAVASALATLDALPNFKADIEYGRAGDESLRLDAFVPEGEGPFPVAIIVHGGGWAGGDKERDITVFFNTLAQAKFVCFSINYRLAPANRWPACFDDVQTAIRWVKAHASEYHGDPRRLALMGYSAGGQLACLAAVMNQPDTRVQAVVGFSAPTDLEADTARRGGLSKSMKDLLDREEMSDEVTQTLRRLSPLNFIKPGLPPFLLIHGTVDQSVQYSQSVNFQSKLAQNGVSCELVTLTNAPHNIMEWDAIDPSYKEKLAGWLKVTLAK